MLKGIKILDFTHRLPGPLAGKILSDLGAEVIKVEDIKHRDPFLSGMFSEFDRSFESWYEELNKSKKVLRFDFKDPNTKGEIHKLLEGAQGLLLSLSPKLKASLGLDDETLKGLNVAVVELEASSTHNKAMHDLNALAISGYLSLHVAHETDAIVAPPFLPVAGIAFGQQVATQMLANIIEASRSKGFVKSVSYLHDTADSILHPFWSKTLRDQKKTKFLHNGAYPCYSLYRTQDGQYVAVAAVEEKFWTDLIATFGINLPLERRFETNEEAFNVVASTFAKLTANEIESRSQNKELCLSIVRKIS
ncbi:CoA transferase [Peredibacter starrii]|uniref:CoA transferase n=1 Tax=Peredibacter starrii TaxID=28202 RepID=A0AAX4HSJ2_9BACT|nr:CoA transferase [Peredibacter starrii]WPU66351.1 CoA transferase [Peredibacter starrii]